MNCPYCGKAIRPEALRCPYCGKTLPQPAATSAGQQRSPVELLRQNRELDELLRYTPSSAGTGVGLIVMSVFGLVFASFAIFFIFIAKRSGAPPIFRFFPVIFVLVGVAMVGAGIRGLIKLATSPLERIPGIVVGKRHEYSSSSRGSGSTRYYVTIEAEDDQRKEHSVRGRVFGELQRGDTGVAYVKGGYLLDFKRVPVPKA